MTSIPIHAPAERMWNTSTARRHDRDNLLTHTNAGVASDREAGAAVPRPTRPGRTPTQGPSQAGFPVAASQRSTSWGQASVGEMLVIGATKSCHMVVGPVTGRAHPRFL